MTQHSETEFLKGKHVVIFGAGYVGGAVALAAKKAGACVSALTRNADMAALLRRSGVNVVEDLLGSTRWHDRIAPGDFVLNSVGAASPGVAGYQSSYVDGMTSINAWAEAVGWGGDLVYTGSTSVYPQGNDMEVDEESAVAANDDRVARLLETESLVAQWRGRSAILRLAGIYGPGRHHILDQLRDIKTHQMAGVGDHRLNLVHRDDVVGAVLAVWRCGERTSARLYNVADGASPTRREFVAWFCARLGRPVPVFSGQPAAGRRRVTPSRLIRARRLRVETGWRPRHPDFRSGYAGILGEGVTPNVDEPSSA